MKAHKQVSSFPKAVSAPLPSQKTNLTWTPKNNTGSHFSTFNKAGTKTITTLKTFTKKIQSRGVQKNTVLISICGGAARAHVSLVPERCNSLAENFARIPTH